MQLLAIALNPANETLRKLDKLLSSSVFSGYKENRTVPEAAREGGQAITQIAEPSLSTHMYTLSTDYVRKGDKARDPPEAGEGCG